ncbi:MAG: SDR family NAD(P)-dependent oxidoreductase, partial [Pseudomonadota bacterium]
NLRIELKGTGVRTTEICPGRVLTEIFDVSIKDPEKASKVKDTGIEELTPGDIADAILFALDAPSRMNVNMIEIQPTDQIFGGAGFAPNVGER